MASNMVNPNWESKYKSLKNYYSNNYDPKYFCFTKYEIEIDPSETVEQIDEYSFEKQKEEIIKCAFSFNYFCHKYVKITHPRKGLLPFILFKYQRRVIDDFDKHRFSIISKFRQGGLTTVTVIWSLWRCLFKLDETIMILSKSDREAIAAGEIVKRALDELPVWLKPQMFKNNDHQKEFSETGCRLFFYTPEAARGRSLTYLILDEAAFVPNMDKYWKAMFPTISTGGNCICISTVNGIGNWYEETYHRAERKENDFHIIDLDYWEHPDYDDEEWVKLTRGQLGEKGWMQEVMRDFLGAGDSYIPPDVINDLEMQIREIDPARILFQEWVNQEEIQNINKDEGSWIDGALQVWREPIEGREYIMGVDAAEGMGEEADNSCLQIIDKNTCEQVAEFYSNTCPPHIFAQIVVQTAKIYNTALVVVESQSAGLAVLNKLQHDFYYENIFRTTQGKSEKPGIKTTSANRPMFLEALQTRLLNSSIAIRSKRFIKELKTFIYNKTTRKAQASKGFHDDAIMALCLSLYARDIVARQVPIGYEHPEEMTEAFKAEIFENIKAELEKNSLEDWSDLDEEDELEELRNSEDAPIPMIPDIKRPNESLLKEFGW